MAKEVFEDAYVSLLDPWDKDPNMEELSPIVASSFARSQTIEENMIDNASKENIKIEDNP